MGRKFKELLDKMTPERRARIKEGAEKLRSEMALDELREARALTQEQLAETLGVRQATVSKMERRTDMYLSSLRKIIEAMGGELEIRAVFPSGPVRINQFRDLSKTTDEDSQTDETLQNTA
jgi:transcriptional regulator with XRE-family HTH domain